MLSIPRLPTLFHGHLRGEPVTGLVCLDRSPPLRTDALMPCSTLCLWTLWAGQGVWAFSASVPWSCPRRGVDQLFLGMGGFRCPCLPHLPGIVLDPTRILAKYPKATFVPTSTLSGF